MRPLLLLNMTLLIALAAPLCEAREPVKAAHGHKAVAGLSRTAQAKALNRNVVRLHQPATRPLQAGVHDSRRATNSRVVARARQLVGIPYRRGGTSVSSGFDCSGLLVYLFRTEAGMKVPRTTGEMIQKGGQRVGRDQLKPGDAVFFNRNGRGNVSHVGLYIGNDQFIHAPSSGGRIRQDSLANSYWERSFTTARRFNG
ncbi:C40 family peptidase [Pseudomonas sp. LA21]|uniref:C40 family peptidase n=1 Tax=Pseudomonas sp. LA21 TaxID=2893373 RepID=UPI001FB83F76|nr:C40 family peptidase [Pseudomonas sp. LA21]MCJ1888473.1 C40 family peptidase [Pseudomonas sp. LA21]